MKATIQPIEATTEQQQTLVIVRLRCCDGIEGIGEATTIGWHVRSVTRALARAGRDERPRRHGTAE